MPTIKYEFHEIANIWSLDRKNIPALAKDIATNKQDQPISLYQGKILDGRRRYLACLEAGVEPQFEDVNPPDPMAFAMTKNDHRRMDSESQRAMTAARAIKWYKQQAMARMSAGQAAGGATAGRGRPKKNSSVANLRQSKKQGKSSDQAGAKFGVSARSVQHANKVLKDGSAKLQAAVDNDDIAVSTAAKIALIPDKAKQDEAVDRASNRPQKKARQNAFVKTSTPSDPWQAALKFAVKQPYVTKELLRDEIGGKELDYGKWLAGSNQSRGYVVRDIGDGRYRIRKAVHFESADVGADAKAAIRQLKDAATSIKSVLMSGVSARWSAAEQLEFVIRVEKFAMDFIGS